MSAEPRAGVLTDILADKRVEVGRLANVRWHPRTASSPRSLRDALRRAAGSVPLRLIAEIKHRSPSAGPLSRVLDPAARARAYQEAGASAVSVLCDAKRFDGSYADLAAVRAAVELPVLCKEFVIDRVQVDRAYDAGADAVLVIVRIVEDDVSLCSLIDACEMRGMDALVEVATHEELARALSAGAHVVGVNARDLDTLAMDAARAAAVLAAIPPNVIAVHLSGIADPQAVARVAATRADAALVGEALMRQDDPRPLLRALVGACGSPAP
ncbi:MAG: indole-3-glycerol-phosphate synthase [Deltaproteobacteria bacterium]|nr:indole-3-glycerol-phosphate synthase [Deltaproteobacteria bacterium]